MKTLQQVKLECPLATVMTTEEYLENVENSFLMTYDGFGYYHDGEKETDVRADYLLRAIIRNMNKYPYVCWYNK